MHSLRDMANRYQQAPKVSTVRTLVRPEKMVRVSACGTRVFVEANGKAAGIEALVYGQGFCLVVHQTILRLLGGYARGKRYITFEADPCLFRIDERNWPVAAFWKGGFPPQEYQEFSPSPSESPTTPATR